MYVKIRDRFFYPIVFIDEYSRYIVHHNLLTAKDADLVSLEAHAVMDKLDFRMTNISIISCRICVR